VMGSPSYMPPEQAAGRHGDIGPASDVYSLGAMLYELLTGQPPFRGATAMATLREVMESEPTAPRRLKADIPPDLETICLKCLEKSPSARYPTARALAEELDRFLKGEPIQARPAGAVRKVVSWARRHPVTLAALAVLVIVTLAIGVYYLFEENAFLRARQANPALARLRRGARHESLQIWTIIDGFTWIAGVISLVALRMRAKGLSVKRAISPHCARPVRPLNAPTRTFAVGLGLILLGCGVMVLVKAIQAQVWEGEPIQPKISLIYLSICVALTILGIVVQDYRLVHYGTFNRKLTAEQIEPIRRALEDRDGPAAIKHFREAVPEAGLLEAKEYVFRLWYTLRAQHSDKFGPPPLSLATLNWRRMGIWALIEAISLGILWYAMPPSYPASAVSKFAYSFLFGMGLTAGVRVKGFWKRILLFMPALALMILSEAIVPGLAKGSSHSSALYGGGFFCGILLMVSGVVPLRKKV
ncbi:MAG: serine/threonine protein kinase, partial [Tepidisphaerales bacterium]